MKLENQVVSLELAKKLKELGVKQDSHFIWHTNKSLQDCKTCNKCKKPNHFAELVSRNDNRFVPYGDWCSAFTVAELFNLLPNGYSIGKCFTESRDDYICGISDEMLADYNPKLGEKCDAEDIDIWSEQTEDTNLANCIAESIIYLIENKLL